MAARGLVNGRGPRESVGGIYFSETGHEIPQKHIKKKMGDLRKSLMTFRSPISFIFTLLAYSCDTRKFLTLKVFEHCTAAR